MHNEKISVQGNSHHNPNTAEQEQVEQREQYVGEYDTVGIRSRE